MKMFYLLLIYTFILEAKAAVYIEEPCPKVKPVENFELSLFTGRWHQIARYQNDFENGTCIIIDIENKNDEFKVEVNDFSSERPQKLKGYLNYATNSHGTGFITIRSSFISEKEGVDLLPINIVEIDYDNYFIAYECRYDEAKKKNHVYAFVDSRAPMLTNDIKTKVQNFIKSSGYIDDQMFLWDHFDPKSCGMNI